MPNTNIFIYSETIYVYNVLYTAALNQTTNMKNGKISIENKQQTSHILTSQLKFPGFIYSVILVKSDVLPVTV